jgi:predicted DNA-binding transcriptional regulator AlpA
VLLSWNCRGKWIELRARGVASSKIRTNRYVCYPGRVALIHIEGTMNEQTTELWTVDDVANFLKMKPSAVYTLTRERGRVRSDIPIPCFKIHSKALRFRKSDVLTWIEQCAQASRLQ